MRNSIYADCHYRIERVEHEDGRFFGYVGIVSRYDDVDDSCDEIFETSIHKTVDAVRDALRLRGVPLRKINEEMIR